MPITFTCPKDITSLNRPFRQEVLTSINLASNHCVKLRTFLMKMSKI